MSTPISLRVERVHRVLGVDERADAAELLGLGEDVVDQRRLAGGLRAEDLDDAAARHAADAEREVERQRARRDRVDLHLRALVAHAHDACPCRTGARSASARPAARRRGPSRPSRLRSRACHEAFLRWKSTAHSEAGVGRSGHASRARCDEARRAFVTELPPGEDAFGPRTPASSAGHSAGCPDLAPPRPRATALDDAGAGAGPVGPRAAASKVSPRGPSRANDQPRRIDAAGQPPEPRPESRLDGGEVRDRQHRRWARGSRREHGAYRTAPRRPAPSAGRSPRWTPRPSRSRGTRLARRRLRSLIRTAPRPAQPRPPRAPQHLAVGVAQLGHEAAQRPALHAQPDPQRPPARERPLAHPHAPHDEAQPGGRAQHRGRAGERPERRPGQLAVASSARRPAGPSTTGCAGRLARVHGRLLRRGRARAPSTATTVPAGHLAGQRPRLGPPGLALERPRRRVDVPREAARRPGRSSVVSRKSSIVKRGRRDRAVALARS